MTDETLAARLAHCEKERDKWRDEAGDYQVKLSVLDHDTTGKIHKLRELIERYKQEQKSYFGENAILEDEAGEWKWMNEELKAERDDLRGRCERLKGALREAVGPRGEDMTPRHHTTWNMYGWKEILNELGPCIVCFVAGVVIGILLGCVWGGSTS